LRIADSLSFVLLPFSPLFLDIFSSQKVYRNDLLASVACTV
jgi:hypothetical protein